MKARPILGFLIAFAVMIAIGLGARSYQHEMNRKEIVEIVGRLKAAGIVMDQSDRPKPPPENENAFLAIAPHTVKNRLQYQPKDPQIQTRMEGVTPAPSGASIAEIEAILKQNEPFLKISDRAFSSCTEFFIPHNFDNGAQELFPEFPGLNAMLQLYCARSYIRFTQGAADEAFADLDVVKRIVNGCIDQPFGISQAQAKVFLKVEIEQVLRLYELFPNHRNRLLNWLETHCKSISCDPKEVVSTEIAQLYLSLFRTFDSPEIEREYRFKLLPFLEPQRTQPLPSSPNRNTSYIPQGFNFRKNYLSSLRFFEPYLKSKVRTGISESDLDFIVDTAPKEIEKLLPNSFVKEFHLGYWYPDKDSAEMLLVGPQIMADFGLSAVRTLRYHEQRNRYPSLFSDLAVKIRDIGNPISIDYQSDQRSFSIKSLATSGTPPTPIYSVDYPVFNDPSQLEIAKSKFKKWKQNQTKKKH
jgi:hypothetical protein